MKLPNIKTSLVTSTLAIASIGALSATTFANPMVGGSPMLVEKNIVQNASNSKDNTTLVAAVKAAGLVGTLEGAGPFTVGERVEHGIAGFGSRRHNRRIREQQLNPNGRSVGTDRFGIRNADASRICAG